MKTHIRMVLVLALGASVSSAFAEGMTTEETRAIMQEYLKYQQSGNLEMLVTPALQADPILDCVSKDNARPICEFTNPEDMVALPGGQAILIGEYGGSSEVPGRLVVFELESEKQYTLFPGGQGNGASQPGWGDPNCATPPGKAFNSHGIDLVRLDDGRLQLLVVQHGSREAVELFEVIGSGADWQVEWRGCVPAPPDAWLNSVAGLSNGDFYTTQMTPLGFDLTQELSSNITGHAFAWSQSEKSFRKISGTDGAMPNGIVTSPDGRFVYMNATAEHSVRKIEVATGREIGRATVALPDNARWAPDGRILIASFSRELTAQDFVACVSIKQGACGLPFRIVALDPDSMTIVETLYANEGAPMGAGTIGLRVGDELFIGSMHGDRILRVNLPTANVEKKLAELMATYGNSTIWPTEEQWRSILLFPNKQPIVTTSFLQLPTGEVHDEKVGFRGSVAEALAKYIDATTPIIERIGVKPIYVSGVPHTVIGDDSNQWDTVVVTQYPSAEAFIELHLDPEYREKSVPYRRLTTKRVIMLVSQQAPSP